MARDEIERELTTLPDVAMVRQAQLLTAMTSISGTLSSLFNAIGDLVQAGQEDARREALAASFNWDDVLLAMDLSAAKRRAMRQYLLEAGRFNVEAMLARVYKTRRPLAEQVYKTGALASGWVERRIDSALARGATVTELAKDVRDFVNPATPGGASYAARRLARTEINAAYHAVVIGHNEDKPWNTGMKWSLSGSHPAVDECDEFARRDHAGLGRGVYRRDSVPPKPHPQCLCYVYPETLTPDAFVRGFRAGMFDAYLAETYGHSGIL